MLPQSKTCCAFHCFICNDFHPAGELGGFIGSRPVCEMQLALVIALGEDLGQEIWDIRSAQYTTVGKEELLLKQRAIHLGEHSEPSSSLATSFSPTCQQTTIESTFGVAH